MGTYAIQSETLQAIADAIRAKTDSSAQLSPAEMVSAINSIITYDSMNLDSMIMRTSEIIESRTATSVAAYAFYNNPAIHTVIIPAADAIGDYAFANSANLEYFSSGAATIGAYAFYGCDALSEVLFADNFREIGVAAFDGCESLESVNLQKTMVSTITPSAFADSGLRELRLPEARFCSLTNVSAFSGCPLGVGGSGGVIYMPMRYRVQYEANTIWSRIIGNGTNRIVTY